LCIGRNEHSVVFEKHEHADVNTARNNMRAAVIHIIAEAAESFSRNLSPVPSLGATLRTAGPRDSREPKRFAGDINRRE
jgi:hypothetical protein